MTEAIIVHQFNESTIQLRATDGYINLNQMADATGKRIDNWLRLQETTSLLREFNSQQNIDSSDPRDRCFAVITVQGRRGGTWAHPDIAIQFAQWCDPKFALQVSRWIREWLTTGQNPLNTPQPTSNPEPPQSPVLPEYKQKRLDAKTAILQSFQQFQANSNLPFSRAAMHFCICVYPQGIPDWVVELHPAISWQSLLRWHSTVKKSGPQALTDRYGKRKSILHTNPEFNAHFTRILTQNPQIPGTELHQTLFQLTPQCPSLPSIQRLKREWLSQRTAIQPTR